MPVRRIVSRICSTYVVQPSHTARCASNRARSSGGKGALEVVGDDLDDLLAGHVFAAHPCCPFSRYSSTARRTRAARPVQQHPLIGLRQVQNVTHLFGGPSQHVAQPDHLGLEGRQGVDRLPHHAERLTGEQPVLREAAPVVRERRPAARPAVIRAPEPRLGDGRTRRPRSTSAENGWLRPSRTPRVLAMLARIRYIHVRSDERPSNLSSPCRIPSHASCTTSSATAWDDTYIRAIRSIIAWCCSTSIMNASSSPARRRSTSARSSGEASSTGSVTAQEPSVRRTLTNGPSTRRLGASRRPDAPVGGPMGGSWSGG